MITGRHVRQVLNERKRVAYCSFFSPSSPIFTAGLVAENVNNRSFYVNLLSGGMS